MWWLLVFPCRFRSRRAMSHRPQPIKRARLRSPEHRLLTIGDLLLGQRPFGRPVRDRLFTHVLDAGGQTVEEERLRAGKADGEEQRNALRGGLGHLTRPDGYQRHEPALAARADPPARGVVS